MEYEQGKYFLEQLCYSIAPVLAQLHTFVINEFPVAKWFKGVETNSSCGDLAQNLTPHILQKLGNGTRHVR